MVGGKLLDELREHERGFREWARQARLAGRMSTEDRSKIEAKAEELIAEGGYKSNDPHVPCPRPNQRSQAIVFQRQ